MGRIRPNITLFDFCTFLLIVTNLAFSDISSLYIIAQILAYGVTGMIILYNHGRVDKSLFYYMVWLILFCAWGVASSIWADVNNTTLDSCLLSVVQVGLISFCIICYCRDMDKFEKAIKALVFSGYVLCLRFFLTVPREYWGNRMRFSNDSVFGKNSIAMTLAFAALALIWLTVTTNVAKGKIIAFLSSFLFMFVAVITGTKKSIIIFAIGIIIFMLCRAHDISKKIKAIIITIMLLLGGYLALMSIPILYNSVGYRFELMLGGLTGATTDNSTAMRMNFSAYAIEQFNSHPVLGLGLDGFRYVNIFEHTYAHNNYLEILADLGIVGFFLYYSIFFILLSKAIKVHKEFQFPILIVVPLLLVDIASVTYSMEMTYILSALVISALNIFEKNKTEWRCR